MYEFQNVFTTIFYKKKGKHLSGIIYRSVTQSYYLQFPCFDIQSIEFCYQPQVSWSEYYILMQHRHIYQLQMLVKMQHSVFRISNNEENITNLTISCSTPQLLKGVDHKGGRLTRLIAFSSLLLILNMLRYILIHIWSW